MIKRKVVVFDFDGTVIPFNSFRIFLIFLLISLVVKLDIKSLFHLFTSVKLKFLKKITHLEFKVRVIAVGEQLTNGSLMLFCDFLRMTSRPKILHEMMYYKNNESYIVALCTAAPFLYMKHFSSSLGIDVLVAYGDPNLPWQQGVDNTGQTKLSQLSRILGLEIATLDAMFSDHLDDLPLLQIAKRAVLVSPKKNMKKKLRDLLPNSELIH
ncbi:MAG TPA: hypothetical protein DHV59_12180 [Oxalobacteraceae bacterium]|nr:hypothetical protein [Oxalobacteraceae bacterium]